MNDDFLHKFRKSPRPEFAADLYQRISEPMKTKSRTRALRSFALAVSMIAVIAAVLLLSPSISAFAQGVIRQFGGYIFVQATPQPDSAEQKIKDLAEKKMKEAAENRVRVSPEQEATLMAQKQQMSDQPSIKPDSARAAANLADNFAPDAASASGLAGFTVLAPAYVPAGYIPETLKIGSSGWSISHQKGSVSASTVFENKSDKDFLGIEELKVEQGEPRTIERPQIIDMTVRGQPGSWMPETDGKNTLVWDENGITYLVVSTRLPLEELLKVAESLGK